MDIYYTIIINTIIAFVEGAIKNPNSDKAQKLKDKLILLANALNQLIHDRWPNG